MSNFNFLKGEFDFIYNEVINAEKYTFIEPCYSALLSRSTLEKSILWLYENDVDLQLPYDNTLAALMHNDAFRSILMPSSIFHELNVIRKTGNNAAHGRKVNQYEALQTLKNLFRFLSFLSVYYSDQNPKIPPFDETLIPKGDEKDKKLNELKKIADQLQEELETTKSAYKKQAEAAALNELMQLQIDKQEAKIKERKKERKEQFVAEELIPELSSEHQTRILLIDLLLKEAGWDDLKNGRDIEFEVAGMPLTTNPTGIGYVDYVLWGKNGLPLAVVEAKKTLYSAKKGKHQATLYANCMEKKYDQRPVIFYSNGFETFLWDDLFYPERRVQGFYTQDELQLLVDRRISRADIRNFVVNKDIVGRPYQLEAIQRVAENFVTTHKNTLKGRNRKSLLVMATGSGKTRVSAAIVDMLTKSNWTKRVLFLADRNALVTQAKNAFKEHLPHLSAIDLTKEKEDNGTRLVFSTYPTIMNKIDSLKNEDGRFYGSGHFDLIIIDEAHRSVYQKYRAIFEYFDALLVGLTATPKKDIDHNTYTLFEIEDDNPTFAYELNQAVTDNYLKPPKAIDVPIKFPLEGVKYSELSDNDKEQFENLFGDPTTGEIFIDEIDKGKINEWLFNGDTVDKVLDHLMTNGLKVDGGDKLGKTIIFARNHKHAEFIEERFNKNYPEYGGSFLNIIDTYADKAQDLLEKFCDDKEEIEPQIAVSVDMMDTGVDAPRVVNLVFFKRVRSYTKFWQMIGRGTRLRPDLFGPGNDKEYFIVFDFCENFTFFEEFPDGIKATATKSISQDYFETKLDIVIALSEKTDSTADEEELMPLYLDDLHGVIKNLDEDRFEVRKSWRQVKDFKSRDRWNNLSKIDVNDIKKHLSNLASYKDDEDEKAKRFDLLIVKLQLAFILNSKSQENFVQRVYEIGKKLYKKRNIPAVASKLGTINEIQNEEFWKNVTHLQLNKVREDIRSLIKFLDSDSSASVYANFEDLIYEHLISEKHILPVYTQLKSYKDRVETFIRKNKHHLVIDKLYKNLPITEKELDQLEQFLFTEELGSKQQYETEYGKQPLGKFVRKIIGLDIETANNLFSELIQSENLTANQITFTNTIISYLNKNGTLDKSLLTKPPFNESFDKGIFGAFKDDENKIVKIISIIDQVNKNAEIA